MYPNPVHKQAVLAFTNASPGFVGLRVYDLSGKQITQLFGARMEKGTSRQVKWNVTNLPAGLYIITLQTTAGITRQKVVE